MEDLNKINFKFGDIITEGRMGIIDSNVDKYNANKSEILSTLEGKIGLCVGETLPEINDRDEKTLYFKVTDTIAVTESENLKVSPTMGLKLV